nr:hypothetical protein [Tanacetum cinerariifolium]
MQVVLSDQTVSGKDSSNSLMADNLPKIVWYSTHHVTLMKSWLVQKQTDLGKDKTNPLIVDSLLKTIWSSIFHLLINEVLTIPGQTTTGVNTPRCDDDRLELMELTVFLLPKVEKVGIGVSAVDLQVSAIRLMLLLLVHKFLLFGLTNWCCSLTAVSEPIHIYGIKQFWTVVTVKKVNDVIRLQALVDKKKVVVTETKIREVLCLDDTEGVECLPNEEIFAELSRMGYEKPSTKLTFYKAFFSSKRNLLRNVDSPSKFYMYPRFLQLMIRNQVGDLSTHTTKYTSLSLTQKVFANMRRIGKRFSRVETPLFEGMLVEQQVDEGDDAEVHGEEINAGDAAEVDVSAAQISWMLRVLSHVEVPIVAEEPSIPSPTPPTPPPQPQPSQDIPSTSQAQPTPPQSPQKVRTTQRVETSDEIVMDDVSNHGRIIADMDADADVVLKEAKEIADDDKEGQNADIQGRTAESQAEIYKIYLDHANKFLSMQEDETEPAELQEVVEVVTTAKLITEVVIAANETITAANANITAGVVIRDPKETTTTSTIIHTEAKSKDKGKGILVEEPKPLKKQAQIKQDEKYARELEAKLNITIDWDEAIDHVKKKAKEDPAVKAKLNSNVAFLQKTREKIEEEESRALKRINETPAERAAKRKKLDEEVEELKRHLRLCPMKMMMSTLKLPRLLEREDLETL